MTVTTHRYLQYGWPVPKSLAWLSQVLPNLDEMRFKIMMRMTRPQFGMILELIQHDPVFLNDKKQLSVSTQLAIVLFRLGSYGSGNSIAKLATLFGVGDGGTVDRVTSRVFQVSLVSNQDWTMTTFKYFSGISSAGGRAHSMANSRRKSKNRFGIQWGAPTVCRFPWWSWFQLGWGTLFGSFILLL